MPIIKNSNGVQISNQAGVINSNQRADAIRAIQQLQLADIYRAGNTIAIEHTVRIDCQGVNGAGQANLQAQLNGVHGNSTIAHVLVDATVGQVQAGYAQQAQTLYAIRQIKGAFSASLNDRTTWVVQGTPT